MKKIVSLLVFSFLVSFCFAVSDTKLYSDPIVFSEIKNNNVYDHTGNITMNIRNNELFIPNTDINVGKISENSDKLSLYVSMLGSFDTQFEYKKPSMYLYKASYYEGETLKFYKNFEYENNRVIKEIYHNIEEKTESYTLYSYTAKTFTASEYNNDNILLGAAECDITTRNKIKSYFYNSDGSIKTQTLYNKETGNALERYIYSDNSKKGEKYTFIQFDENGIYSINDDFYLSSNMGSYISIKILEKTSDGLPIDWDDKNNALISKYEFTNKDIGYSIIHDLIQKHCLCDKSFVLCNRNTNLCYCFTTNEDDEIDISSCYEIKLIEKPLLSDYAIFRKNGNNLGPFGLDIGMTYDEVKNACGGEEPEYAGNDLYYIKPKKNHSLFEKYLVWISATKGLYYIKAISKDIYTSNYGTEVKKQFMNLLISLEKKYGKFEITDTVKSDYLLKDEQYWIYGLRNGARTYQAAWNTTTADDIINYNGITSIILGVRALDLSTTYIYLEYAFFNVYEIEQEKDDVL